MEEPFTLHLDDKPVRFTPDGKISIIDAIGATTQSNHARAIWESLKVDHPEVLTYCEDYPFQGKPPLPVADSAGWEMIMMLLLCDLSGDDLEKPLYCAAAG
ncbi:MAG: hypothetical protein A2Z08_06265 [Deltaproteobacteria bacterium RBG_16_54_11]|jgi:hypothetical protein|nr:MAG: hypothetical protein A2Z08_06265 [Deltaproteobacteria bacterium RBG_16_54_11]